MAWTTPRTWITGELATAAMLNTHIRDNFDWLKTPPFASGLINEAADYTITTTGTFTDVDAVDLSRTIVTAGGNVLILFQCTVQLSTATGGASVFFDIDVNGVRLGGDDGLMVCYGAATTSFPVTLAVVRAGLSVGSHTFKVQWRTAGTVTATLFAGAGTASRDVHPQFTVREI